VETSLHALFGGMESFLARKHDDVAGEEEMPNLRGVEECYPIGEAGARALDELIKERRPRSAVTLGLLKVWSGWEDRGLPRALRLHRRKGPGVARLHRPTAEELFPYVLRSQPVVISGCLDGDNFPPLRDFADLYYLRARCGERLVPVKADSLFDRAGREVFLSDPGGEVRFSDFLDRIEECEQCGISPSAYLGKVSLDKVLPELVEDIESAPETPLSLFGSCFGINTEGVFTYFGCGRNSTGIHCDPGENLLAVICGTKHFDLFPPSDADCLYPCRPPSMLCSGVPPLILPDSMPEDLRERCPLYKYAHPVHVTLKAGDMLYLPAFWWHGVTGSMERNMILNFWCDMHPQKEDIGAYSEGARFVCQKLVEGMTSEQ